MAETIQTFDHRLPLLPVGRYAASATQALTPVPKDASPTQAAPWSKTAEFEVVAPRLLPLDSSDVHSVYPPAGNGGDYGTVLPHIVLSHPTLPWDRSAGSGPNDKFVPWLALLLLDESEVARASLRRGSAGELLTRAGERAAAKPLLDPPLTPDESKQQISVLELSADLSARLLPSRSDRTMLAHVRQVELENKPKTGDAGLQREYAVVAANRVPHKGDYTALLVSLEGHPDTPVGPAGRHLVVLHQWQFRCEATGKGTFAGRAGDLDLRPFAVPATDGWDPALRWALAQSYVPVAEQQEPGRKVVSWYRGPLVAKPASELEDGPVTFRAPASRAIAVADQADLSWDAAWHLGRTLALGSATLVAALGRWAHIEGDLRRTKRSDGSRTLFVEKLAGFLETVTDRHPLYSDALAIACWLARLHVLDQVPLRYLVPSGAMLPAESLRGFWIDRGWVEDGLVMGALAMAQQFVARTGGGIGLDTALRRKDIRALLARILRHTRKAAPGDVPAADAQWGFLLRSRLLKDFPGLEVRLGRGDKPLRFERVGDDMLFVLAAKQPASIALREPREGIYFGCGHRGELAREGGAAVKLAPFRRDAEPDSPLEIARLAEAVLGKPAEGAALSSAAFARVLLRKPGDVTVRWKSPK